ncbi:MAG: divalent-cation tolerance protein CutA, partial [bacterium]|nr:divalent-cation tolerance protein CutA [bacterium]
ALVEARLAACATVLPEARSFYRWGENDAIQDDREAVVFIKTHREKLAALEEFFRAHHPYDCPELVVVDIASLSESYRDWLRRQLHLE